VGGVDGPLLQRWVNVAARDLLGHDAELLQRLAGPAADAELQPIEILDGFDLLSKPSAHLRTGIAGDKTIDVRFLGEFVHEFHAVAVVKPGILLAGVEAERNGTEKCPSRILAHILLNTSMTQLHPPLLY